MNWQWNVDLFRPPLGVGPTVLLLAAAVMASLWLYLGGPAAQRPWIERLSLLSLRLLAVALLAWMLVGPSRRGAVPAQPEPVRVVVLADRSASMAVCDVHADSVPGGSAELISRWEQLRQSWLDESFLADMQSLGEVELYTFAESLRPVTLDRLERETPDGLQTNLFEALDKAARSPGAGGGSEPARPGVILLLSDGRDTQRQDAAGLVSRLKQQGWPVYAVPVGTDLPVKDLAVLAWADSDLLFTGQSTVIHATVTHEGLAGQQAVVSLLREGQVQARQTVTLEAGRPLQLDFPVQPDPLSGGPLSVEGYQIAVEPLPGERHLDNNQRWVFLQVSRQRIRVALFDAAPYWDTRFLALALRGDPQIDLTSIFALAPQRVLAVRYAGEAVAPVDVQLPITAEQLAGFDVVILGKHMERFFGGERGKLLADYVTTGGGSLVLARGQAFDVSTPEGAQAQALLAAVEPVAWGRSAVEGLKLELTPAGQTSPLLQFEHPRSTEVILTEMPGLLAATAVAQERAASIVLLRQDAPGDAPAMAALAHQAAGSGRVLAVLGEGLWQWAFLPARMRQYDSIYQQFWGQAIRWLAASGQFLPGQKLSMTLSRLMVEPGQETTVTVTMRSPPPQDWTPSLRVIDPLGRAQDLPLHQPTQQSLRYVGFVRPQQAGVHVIELNLPTPEPARLTARLAVYDASLEKLDAAARPQTLQALATATGGELLDPRQPQRFLQIVQRLGSSRQTQEQVTFAFDLPVVMVSLWLLLGVEWCLRRRRGLW